MSNSPSLDSGSSAEEHSQNGEGEQAKRGIELASRVLDVDKKRYYIDVVRITGLIFLDLVDFRKRTTVVALSRSLL